MSLHPDMRQATVAPKTVEKLRRAPRPIHTPRWLLPVAVVLFAVVAAIIGVNVLRSDDTTTTALEPLIVPAEQEFIDARTGPPSGFGRGTASPAPVTQTPDVVIHQRPQGIPGMIDYYELEYIESRTPMALAPSPESVGFPQVMVAEELAFINGEYFRQPRHGISLPPQGIPGMIGYYELEFIRARTPFALAPTPESVGFPQVVGPQEQATIEAHTGPVGHFGRVAIYEDWCLTNRPC